MMYINMPRPRHDNMVHIGGPSSRRKWRATCRLQHVAHEPRPVQLVHYTNNSMPLAASPIGASGRGHAERLRRRGCLEGRIFLPVNSTCSLGRGQGIATVQSCWTDETCSMSNKRMYGSSDLRSTRTLCVAQAPRADHGGGSAGWRIRNGSDNHCGLRSWHDHHI